MPDMVGRTLGGYRIEAELGRGRQGVVYLATQFRLQRLVALKVLSAESAADEEFLDRFTRSGIAAAGLDHPHIVPVYEAGEVEGVAFLAMKFVDGASLGELIGQEGRLPPARALGILVQVAEALDFAHGRGLVHGDVKPSNVLVDERDYAYLSDLGLARGLDDAGQPSPAAPRTGTLQYTAPELVRGARMDRPADRYALAAVAYEALTGRPPFQHDERSAMRYSLLNEVAAGPSEVVPGLDAAGDAVMSRGLAKEPADRYPSATGFVTALADALRVPLAPPVSPVTDAVAAQPPPPPAPAGPPPPPRAERPDRAGDAGRRRSFSRLSPGRLAAIAAGVAVLAVGISLALTIPGSDDHGDEEAQPTTTPATTGSGETHTTHTELPPGDLGKVLPEGIEHWDLTATEPRPVNLTIPEDAAVEGDQGIRHSNHEAAQITEIKMASAAGAADLAEDLERQLGVAAHQPLELATGTGSLYSVNGAEISVLQFDDLVVVGVTGTTDGAEDLANHISEAVEG